ncbi:MAG: hypothetical protein ACKO14_00510 [Armatimonadota bacterium]
MTPLTSLSGKVSSGGLVNAYQAMIRANQVELVSLRLTRDVLRGGDSVTAELTLDRSAAAGGVVADLSSSNPAVDLPVSVRIPGGMSTVTVSGVARTVGMTTTGDVSATVQGKTLRGPVTVKPPMLSAAHVTLSVLAPGGVTQGVVTLQQPAGLSGLDVLLTSDNPGIIVPTSVHIDAGQTETEFSVTVAKGCVSGAFQIKASTDADCVCIDIAVLGAVLQNVGFSPAVVVSGQPMLLRVWLSAPAPVGGLVVTLQAGTSHLQIPREVVIPAGETQIDVQSIAPSVSSNEAMAITAGFYGTSFGATVLVVPCKLTAVIPDVSDLEAGAMTTVAIRLEGIAGPGGYDVQLSDASGLLTFPRSVHIMEGQSSAVVLLRAANVNTRLSVVLVASDGLTELSVPFTVSPVDIALLSLSTAAVTGGAGATGTIAHVLPAPGSGVDIALTSSNSSVSVPVSVHIPAGATRGSFAPAPSPVREKVIVDISASAGTLVVSKSLTVNPAMVLSVKLQRTSMIGGSTQDVTVNLSGPAPDGGVIISMSTTNTAVRLPTTLRIPAGATSGVVSVLSVPVASKVTGQLVAQVGALKKTASVGVIPAVISSIVASRGTIVSGESVDFTVNLTGVAPAGGTSMVLTSASAALSVPASVTVPAGQTSISFTAASNPVAKAVSVKITDKTGLVSKSGYVAVTPR